jgi:tRNA(fMet)-specific endonuclease VapC
MTLSRLAASALLMACLGIPACAQAGETPKALLHGNYCDHGNNAPLPPIDDLDAACARHDDCTPAGGLGSKACNLRLQAEAEGVAQDPSQPADLRALAGVVASGAAMMPSAPSSRSVARVGGHSLEGTPVTRMPYDNGDTETEEDEAAPE